MKTLLTVAFVAAAVIAPELIPELLPAGIGLLATAAITAAVEIGIGLAATALIGPAVPKGLAQQINNQVQRLFVTSDTTAPRKIVFGITAAPADIRYQ